MLIILSKKKLLIYGLIIALIIISLITAKTIHSQTQTASSNQERLVPIYKVATSQNELAISFDASWGAEHTLAILDMLDQYQIKATFFLVNIWLNDYPQMASEIAARGHEIGLHSVSHPHFPDLSPQQMREELLANAALIKEITGYDCRLFRPPFGDYNNDLLNVAAELGFTTIQWSVDSLDWQDLSAAEISDRVLTKSAAGDIVLFHNNGLHTAEALPQILEQLAAQGLKVKPISELLLQGDYYIDHNGVQKKG